MAGGFAESPDARQFIPAAIIGLCLVVAAAAPRAAQGEPSGTLRGTVRLAPGTAVPGALVTATSPALQGERTTTTGPGGSWILRNLAPGPYTLRFELEAIAPAAHRAVVALGGETVVDAELQVLTYRLTVGFRF